MVRFLNILLLLVYLKVQLVQFKMMLHVKRLLSLPSKMFKITYGSMYCQSQVEQSPPFCLNFSIPLQLSVLCRATAHLFKVVVLESAAENWPKINVILNVKFVVILLKRHIVKYVNEAATVCRLGFHRSLCN